MNCTYPILFLSSVGVFKNGRVEIIANDQGNRITPSYVAFTTEGERLIGDAAKNQLTSNPENTVFDAKRIIGRTWGDSSVQQDIKYFPFKYTRLPACVWTKHPFDFNVNAKQLLRLFQVIEKKNKPHIQLDIGSGQMKTFALRKSLLWFWLKWRRLQRLTWERR